MSDKATVSFHVGLNEARHLCNIALLLTEDKGQIEVGGYMIQDSLSYLIDSAMNCLIDEDTDELWAYLRMKLAHLERVEGARP